MKLELLDHLAGEAGKTQDILLRVSPGIDPHTHVYTTTGILDSKFGFSIQTGHAAIAVRQALAAKNLNLRGLHFHLGSPVFELEPYQALPPSWCCASPPSSARRACRCSTSAPGGGFAVAYTRDQQPPSVADYAETICSAMTATCDDLGMELPTLVVEPGRSIIGPAGVALYRVGAIKDIPGRPQVRQR